MEYTIPEIEKLFIGSLIADSDNVIKAIDIVGENDLTTREASVSFDVIKRMFFSKQPINLQSFLLEPDLKDCFSFLNEAGDIGISSNCVRFAEEIAEQASLRRLNAKCKQFSNFNGSSSNDILNNLKDVYTSEVKGGSETGDITAGFNELDEYIEINKSRGSLGIETGIIALDQLDVEYEPGHLWAIGGYTSVGKTSLMIEQIVRTNFKHKIAIHSTEMKRHQVIARLLAAMSGVSHKLILKGTVQSRELSNARNALLKSGLKVYDKNRDFDRMWNQCRKDKMQDGLDLVFCDYFQNFKRKGVGGYELFAGMGKDALEIPQELDLTMVFYSQIALTEFKDDSGGVAFKGAGELGESCDIGFWLTKMKSRENSMMVEFRKNRHGAKKDFCMEFQPFSNRLKEVVI
jgi:replicative DNA helicase